MSKDRIMAEKCPCGGYAHVITSESKTTVQCDFCGRAYSQQGWTLEDAIRVWNYAITRGGDGE